jgi:PAS domain S-box-containing protein
MTSRETSSAGADTVGTSRASRGPRIVVALLAAGTLASSLVLNHFLERQYRAASVVSAQFSAFQSDLAALLPRMGDLTDPANRATEPGNAARAAQRIEEASHKLGESMQSLLERVPTALGDEAQREIASGLGTVEAAFRRLQVQARQLVSYLRNGEREYVATAVTALNRQAQTLSIAIARVQARVGGLETDRLNAEAARARELRFLQHGLTGTAAVVAALVLLYMRNLNRAWDEARARHARIAQESRRNAERFALAARGTHDGIWDWSAESGEAFFSDRLHELLGLAPGSLRRLDDFWGLVHPDDVDLSRAIWEAHVQGRGRLRIEYRLRHASGEYRWFVLRGEALREAGKVRRVAGSLTDITARKLAELQLRETAAQMAAERARLAAFVKHAPAAIAMFDSGLRFICASRRWIESFVGQDCAVAGRSLWEVVTEAPRGWRDALPRVLEGEVLSVDDEPWKCPKDRSVRHLRWEARPWTEEGVGRPGLMLSVQDITGDYARATELAGMRDAAEAASRAKSEFLATMSHEIRTPMNGVLGFTQLLLDTRLDEEQREFVRTIDSCGRSLLALINDILDYSKIEAGRLSVEQLDFDVDPLIEEVASLLSPQVFAKGLDLLIDLAADAPRRLRGDPTRVRQVLLNLVGNALKFTERGHILVELAPDLEGMVRISVTDTGIGMSEQVQRNLFRKFVQGDSTTTRRFGGTGLGLAICKQLVELMGGQIGVQSTPGVGSRLWFTIPVARTVAEAMPALGTAPESLRGLRVLVVDDIEPNRRILSTCLARWGMEYETAASGREALERLATARERGAPFDLAIVDYLMPELDGESMCRRLRRDPAYDDLALLMLTSSAQRGEASRMLEAGFDVYLAKPLTRASRLLDAIAEARARRSARLADTLLTRMAAAPAGEPAAVQAATAVGPSAGATPSGDGPLVLIVEDNAVNRLLAERVLAKFGVRTATAEDGERAVAAWRELRPALVLMDCHMPRMDGFAATTAIRALEAGSDRRTPIVALSAGVLSEERERCLAAGMDGFLAKPLVPADLQRALERWGVRPGVAAARAASA